MRWQPRLAPLPLLRCSLLPGRRRNGRPSEGMRERLPGFRRLLSHLPAPCHPRRTWDRPGRSVPLRRVRGMPGVLPCDLIALDSGGKGIRSPLQGASGPFKATGPVRRVAPFAGVASRPARRVHSRAPKAACRDGSRIAATDAAYAWKPVPRTWYSFSTHCPVSPRPLYRTGPHRPASNR